LDRAETCHANDFEEIKIYGQRVQICCIALHLG
jgi:hypothetical protein